MRTKSGLVTSIKMDKTVVITIDSYKINPKYKKKFKISKKFYAHDENNSCELGQIIKIQETRPLSKLKKWIVVN
ncbi:30S ribosomal protein S17 [Candidatus Gracilibacteria bacterium]|nr:30S ribosomal protein S17 [Candidatus Gracilibacteria bacterium]